MIFLDVFYIAIATIGVMALLQLATFVVMKILYPPEPKVIYREVQVPMQAPPTSQPPMPLFSPPVEKQVTFTQERQDIPIPQHGAPPPAIPTSIRVDPELPAGIQETRPPGT
jgi:hypothetical protein